MVLNAKDQRHQAQMGFPEMYATFSHADMTLIKFRWMVHLNSGIPKVEEKNLFKLETTFFALSLHRPQQRLIPPLLFFLGS